MAVYLLPMRNQFQRPNIAVIVTADVEETPRKSGAASGLWLVRFRGEFRGADRLSHRFQSLKRNAKRLLFVGRLILVLFRHQRHQQFAPHGCRLALAFIRHDDNSDMPFG